MPRLTVLKAWIAAAPHLLEEDKRGEPVFLAIEEPERPVQPAEPPAVTPPETPPETPSNPPPATD